MKIYRAFTIIELMITIAILLIIFSILTPALDKVNFQARKVDCYSNLKSMGVAVGVYLGNNYDIYMDHRRGLQFNWHDHLRNLGMAYEDFRCLERGDFWTSSIDPDVSYPVVVKTNPRQHQSAHHLMPYGYNAFWLGIAPYRQNPFLKRDFTMSSDVEFPSEMLVIADSKLSTKDTWASTLWFPKRVKNEGVSDVHHGESNLLWADGHVGSLEATSLNESPDYLHYWRPQNP